MIVLVMVINLVSKHNRYSPKLLTLLYIRITAATTTAMKIDHRNVSLFKALAVVSRNEFIFVFVVVFKFVNDTESIIDFADGIGVDKSLEGPTDIKSGVVAVLIVNNGDVCVLLIKYSRRRGVTDSVGICEGKQKRKGRNVFVNFEENFWCVEDRCSSERYTCVCVEITCKCRKNR